MDLNLMETGDDNNLYGDVSWVKNQPAKPKSYEEQRRESVQKDIDQSKNNPYALAITMIVMIVLSVGAIVTILLLRDSGNSQASASAVTPTPPPNPVPKFTEINSAGIVWNQEVNTSAIEGRTVTQMGIHMLDSTTGYLVLHAQSFNGGIYTFSITSGETTLQASLASAQASVSGSDVFTFNGTNWFKWELNTQNPMSVVMPQFTGVWASSLNVYSNITDWSTTSEVVFFLTTSNQGWVFTGGYIQDNSVRPLSNVNFKNPTTNQSYISNNNPTDTIQKVVWSKSVEQGSSVPISVSYLLPTFDTIFNTGFDLTGTGFSQAITNVDGFLDMDLSENGTWLVGLSATTVTLYQQKTGKKYEETQSVTVTDSVFPSKVALTIDTESVWIVVTFEQTSSCLILNFTSEGQLNLQKSKKFSWLSSFVSLYLKSVTSSTLLLVGQNLNNQCYMLNLNPQLF